MTHDPLHQRLRQAAAGLDDAPVALARLAELHGPAAQGTLLVLLAAPCVLPVPGIGNVMGLGLMLLALAMWRGGAADCLPPRVAGFELSATWARRVLGLLAHFYALAGRWSRQRWTPLAGSAPQRWQAAKVGLMGGLIFLPIPLGNVLPALALVLLGLGFAFRDGLAVLLAAAAGAAALAYTAALGAAVWAWGLAPLQQWLGGLWPGLG